MRGSDNMPRFKITKVYSQPMTKKQKFIGYWVYDSLQKSYVGKMGRGPRLFKTRIAAQEYIKANRGKGYAVSWRTGMGMGRERIKSFKTLKAARTFAKKLFEKGKGFSIVRDR